MSTGQRLTTGAPSVGEELPPFSFAMTEERITLGAAATRDWQPQHHDPKYAVEQAGLRDIILNTPTQSGWLSRYITDWSGPQGRIARLRLQMRTPVYPGDFMQLRGSVTAAQASPMGWWWMVLGLQIRVAQKICTDASAMLAMPGENGVQPWQAMAKEWSPPDWNLRSLALPN
jgi:acyl dehydratase